MSQFSGFRNKAIFFSDSLGQYCQTLLNCVFEDHFLKVLHDL